MKKSLLTRALEPALKLPADPPQLPSSAGAPPRVFRAAEAFLRYRYLGLMLGSLVAAVSLLGAMLATIVAEQWAGLAVVFGVSMILLAQWMVALAVTRLDWELRYYVVTDRALRIREGAWTLRELTLTFLNVQNVTIEQGPLERIFGLANVVVSTAGGGSAGAEERGSTGGHRAVVRGVTNAAEIRDLIRSRLEAARRDAGLGDADDTHPAGRMGAALDSELALLQQIRAETAALARATAARG